MKHELISLKFLLKCHERGWTVSKPIFPKNNYDFVIENTVNRTFRIKLKVAGKEKNTRYKINTRHSESTLRSYSEQDFDHLVVYLISLDTWYIIPIQAFSGKKTINLYPLDSKGGYEKYLEFWML